jgi:putative ATP-binding cassette transporter
MNLFLFLIRHARRSLFFAVGAGILSGAASTGLLVVINLAVTGGYTRHSLPLLFLVLAVAAMVLRIVSGLLLTALGQHSLFDIRMDMCRRIVAVPLRKLEEYSPSRIIGVLTDDVPNITNFISAFPVLCVNAAIILTCLIYLAFLSWPLLLTLVGFMAVGMVSYQLLSLSAHRHLTLARNEHSGLLKHFRALIEGMKELKLHRPRRARFFSGVLQQSATNFRKEYMSAMKVLTLAASWGELLVFAAIGFVVFVYSHLTFVSVTTLTGFILTFVYLMGPLELIMNTAPQFGRASVALKNVDQMGLALKNNAPDLELAPSQPASSGSEIRLADVSFSYGHEDGVNSFLLGPLNLTFDPGQITFITGGNGSGKTTLAKLITGLYMPATGVIYLDGKLVTSETLDDYRQSFSAVFYDFYLFDSLLGLEDPTVDQRASQYLGKLQLNDKVAVKDGVLSTTNLSQGQRKRLALLTAYLEDRPIYFFDEWAADQDSYFRDIFYFQILPELKQRGKTVLIISHDESYYHAGDRVIKLESGRVVSDQPISQPSLLQELHPSLNSIT